MPKMTYSAREPEDIAVDIQAVYQVLHAALHQLHEGMTHGDPTRQPDADRDPWHVPSLEAFLAAHTQALRMCRTARARP